MEGLTEGRMVHYVLPDGRNVGEHRPAIVVKVWDVSPNCPPPPVQLAVFIDGTNDYANLPVQDGSFMSVVRKTNILYSESKEPDTWHWIEKA